jgi:hypothetical protein
LLQGGLNDCQPFGRRQLLQFCQEVEALIPSPSPARVAGAAFSIATYHNFSSFFKVATILGIMWFAVTRQKISGRFVLQL